MPQAAAAGPDRRTFTFKTRRIIVVTARLAFVRNVVLIAFFFAHPAVADSLQEYLKTAGRPPVEYVLAKVAVYPIVILGENHWQRRDEELIVSLMPELQRRKVAYASELLDGESQASIDALLAAPAWNQVLANRIMHASNWPYVQYRDILYGAWKANRERAADSEPIVVIALGPPPDFREKHIDYESYMADRVMKYAPSAARHILIHCGMHHAFTRYQQIELGRMESGRATELMDRAGNILWRRYAQNTFLVALHKADGCGGTREPFSKLCAPLNGIIDCAAERNGGQAVAFDILGSPLAETKFPPESFYAIAHPLLRTIDYADGYIWQEPVDRMTLVDLIPLGEYEPDSTADDARLARWKQRAEDLENPAKRTSWATLPDWRKACSTAK